MRIGQKPKGGQGPTHAAAIVLKGNADVEAALRRDRRRRRRRGLDVVPTRVRRPEPVLDVLVVDEAGQMSLANVLACAPPRGPSCSSATRSSWTSRPRARTRRAPSAAPCRTSSPIPPISAGPGNHRPDEGLFLDTTWRLHPEICDFTSRAFYAGRLRPRDGLEGQAVIAPRSAGPLSGTGVR